MKTKPLFLRAVILLITLMSAMGANAAEAYACYTSSNKTLTFYYDNQRSSCTGKTYDLNTGDNIPNWYYDGIYEDVTNVDFDASFAGARLMTTSYWFYDMKNLQFIANINNLNTSEVVYMNGMFEGCSSLTFINLGNFDTSNVTNMGNMFRRCTGLTSLSLHSFITSKVTNMFCMFAGCKNLTTIYVGLGWNTSALTDAGSIDIFSQCTRLVGEQGTCYNSSNSDRKYAHIDGGTSNPGYLTAAYLLYACYTSANNTLTFYYDKKYNSRMSYNSQCYYVNNGKKKPAWETDNTNTEVKKVVFDSSFASIRPTTTFHWFYGMDELESITNLKYLNTSKVTSMGWMFFSCVKLTSLDLTSFDTSMVTDMSYMFMSCSDLISLDLSSFDTAKVTDLAQMFYGCSNLKTIYASSKLKVDVAMSTPDMFSHCENLVGGMGTTYNPHYVGYVYARIDGGPSRPGYFTRPPSSITTDLHQVTSDQSQVISNEWYTIDGLKMNGIPAKKGVYIQNGKKTVVH